MNKAFGLLFVLFLSVVQAETITLEQAIEKALQNDPRISELENFVKQAQALKREAEGSSGLQLISNTFIGLSPALEGGFFSDDQCGASGNVCKSRADRYKIIDSGLSPWWYLEFGLIKPLKTFGKIEHFTEAAKNNIKLKEQDVRLQRGNTIFDVNRAYFGYLTARDSRLFLDDVSNRITSALETAQINLEEERGDTTQADVYALQSALGLANSFVKKAAALETVAIQGLKVLIGVDLNAPLDVADKGLKPVELPDVELDALTKKAMNDRPEMLQLNSGLQAKKALINAKKAMKRPNVYAGILGSLSYSPMRDRIDNPHIHDPFNDIGTTPVVGMQWHWEGAVQNARVQQEQAELDALMEKNRFAQRGIPYQVSEAYEQVNAHFESVQELRKSARAARRWMVSRYTEYEAGIESVDKLVSAFQAYVLAYSDYLQTVYAYNMQVAQLNKAIGDYQ